MSCAEYNINYTMMTATLAAMATGVVMLVYLFAIKTPSTSNFCPSGANKEFIKILAYGQAIAVTVLALYIAYLLFYKGLYRKYGRTGIKIGLLVCVAIFAACAFVSVYIANKLPTNPENDNDCLPEHLINIGKIAGGVLVATSVIMAMLIVFNRRVLEIYLYADPNADAAQLDAAVAK